MATVKSIKFTVAALERLPVIAQRYTVKDTEQHGLQCRVNPSGNKVLEVRRHLSGTARSICVKVCTLGAMPMTGKVSVRSRVAEILSDISQGINPNEVKRAKAVKDKAESLTLGTALDRYLEESKGGIKPMKDTTAARYRREVKNHFADWLGKRLVDIIHKQTLKERQRKITRESGPVAANNAMRVLRAVSEYFREDLEDDAGVSPIRPWPIGKKAGKRFWNADNTRTNWVEPEYLPDWWNATERLPEAYSGNGELARDYLQFVLLTGLRRREATHKLRWENIDFRAKTFQVPDTKNHSTLELPLSPYLVEILKRRGRKDSGRVFPIEEPKKFIAWVTRESGVAFSSHDLRRSFITYAEQLDLGAYTLKALINHSAKGTSTDVTSGYVQVTTERLREPQKRITDLILKTAGVKATPVATLGKKHG